MYTIKGDRVVFINREGELDQLERSFQRGGFQFLSVIGRRRVGKTELAKQFLKDRKGIYLYVPIGDSLQIRLRYAEILNDKLDISLVGRPSWRDLFVALFERSEREEFVVVFDEFQRFLEVDESVPSILQEVIDEYKEESEMTLCVIGSSIGMMRSMFESSAPLYGRRTAQLWIDPFDYWNAKEFFPGSEREKVRYYGVFGGTPKYLEFVDQEKDLGENIEDAILSSSSILYDEPETLLSTELDSPQEYLEILKLISQGKQSPKEITDNLDIKQTSFNYYAKTLVDRLSLVKKEAPATENPEKSKKTHYRINDNFFRFWFRFVYLEKDQLELSNVEGVKRGVMEEIDSYTGRIYEDIALDWIRKINGKFGLGTYERIGRWWDRDGNELDICGTSKDGVLLGEVKYGEIDVSTAEKLLKKIGDIGFFDDVRQRLLIGGEVTPEAKKLLDDENVLCFELENLAQILGE